MPVNSFDNYPMSWKPEIDRNSRSLYKDLARQLEDDIVSGSLKPGMKLPPQRELADYLDVNVSTISKAFKLCEMKGLLSATVGSGTFVAYDALTTRRLTGDTHDGRVIDMGPTVPEHYGNEFLKKMLMEELSDENLGDLFGYIEPGSVEWHRDTAEELLKLCGCRMKDGRIITSSGAQNGLTAVLASMFRRGDRIAVDDHTYPGIKTAARMFGIQLVPVEGDEGGMNPDALDFACRNENIKGVYLIPACHNPTTVTMGEGRRDEIAEVINKHDCLLIEDGTYQLMHRGMKSVSDRVPGRSIYIVTMSKIVAPGLRIAYMAVPEECSSGISDVLYGLNVSVVPMMAELSARIIASGNFEDVIEKHRINTVRRNRIIDRLLPGRCRGREDDIFRWLMLPEEISGDEMERAALEKGVQVFSSRRFAVGRTRPEHAVRLSVCRPEDEGELETGIKVIADILRSL